MSLRRVGPALMLLVGVSLWAQLFASALAAEWSFADTRVQLVLAYAAPLIVLATGAALRQAAVMLLVFPLACLPGLVMLPDADRAFVGDGQALFALAATFGVYLLLAAATTVAPRRSEFEDLLDDPVPDAADVASDGAPSGGVSSAAVSTGAATTASTAHATNAGAGGGAVGNVLPVLPFDYRWYFGSRLCVVVALLAILMYAVYFDDGVRAEILRTYAGSEAAVSSFLGIAMFFVWTMVVYLMVLMPTMNLEYDQRVLANRIEAMAAATSRGSVLRRLAGLAAASAALGAGVWLSGYLG